MMFQVIRDNEILFSTAQRSCIYSDALLRAIQNSGCKFKLDGKKATLKEVKSFRENGI